MASSEKQQFNVTLPVELVRQIKHRSIDVQLSLSDLVTHVLSSHLSTEDPPMTRQQRSADDAAAPATAEPAASGDDLGLQLQPVIHVQDMGAALAFYQQLGGAVIHDSRDGDWALVAIGGAQIGLLAHPPNPEQGEGPVELNFETTTALPTLEAHLRDAGVTITRPTTDEGFGRQLQITTPDGLLIKINELDPELYR